MLSFQKILSLSFPSSRIYIFLFFLRLSFSFEILWASRMLYTHIFHRWSMTTYRETERSNEKKNESLLNHLAGIVDVFIWEFQDKCVSQSILLAWLIVWFSFFPFLHIKLLKFSVACSNRIIHVRVYLYEFYVLPIHYDGACLSLLFFLLLYAFIYIIECFLLFSFVGRFSLYMYFI